MKCPHSDQACDYPRCTNPLMLEFNTVCKAEHVATCNAIPAHGWSLNDSDRRFLRSLRIAAE